MVRRPPDRRQRSLLFGGADDTPAPPDDPTTQTDGGHHAVHDDHSRTVAATAPDARPAPQESQAAHDGGTLRQGTEVQPRGVEENADAVATQEPPGADRQRSAGDSPQGNRGSFTRRFAGGERSAGPRRGDALSPPHTARLNGWQKRPSLFDSLTSDLS